MVGKSDFDLFSDEHALQAFEDEKRIMQTGEPVIDLEERETWPDRPDTWVSTTKMPLRDAQGRIIGTFGVSRDITARKRAEATRSCPSTRRPRLSRGTRRPRRCLVTRQPRLWANRRP